MRAYWDNLEPREKRLIQLAGGFLSLLLVYVFLIEPISASLGSQRQQLIVQRETAVWLHKQWQQYQNAFPAQGKRLSREDILTEFSSSLSKSPLAKFPTSISQSATEEIHLENKKVPFHTILEWLYNMDKRYEFQIVKCQMDALSTPGLVSVDLLVRAH